jgi:hypothetical protein
VWRQRLWRRLTDAHTDSNADAHSNSYADTDSHSDTERVFADEARV